MGATKSVETEEPKLIEHPKKFQILDKYIPNESPKTSIVYTQNDNTITVSQKVTIVQLMSAARDIVNVHDFLWNDADVFKTPYAKICPICNEFISITGYRVLDSVCCPDCIKTIREYQSVSGTYYIKSRILTNVIFACSKDQIRCNTDIPIVWFPILWFPFKNDFQKVAWVHECLSAVNDLVLRKLTLGLNATRHMDMCQDIRHHIITWLLILVS